MDDRKLQGVELEADLDLGSGDSEDSLASVRSAYLGDVLLELKGDHEAAEAAD